MTERRQTGPGFVVLRLVDEGNNWQLLGVFSERVAFPHERLGQGPSLMRRMAPPDRAKSMPPSSGASGASPWTGRANHRERRCCGLRLADARSCPTPFETSRSKRWVTGPGIGAWPGQLERVEEVVETPGECPHSVKYRANAPVLRAMAHDVGDHEPSWSFETSISAPRLGQCLIVERLDERSEPHVLLEDRTSAGRRGRRANPWSHTYVSPRRSRCRTPASSSRRQRDAGSSGRRSRGRAPRPPELVIGEVGRGRRTFAQA